jgi:hypothetical protein
MNVVIDDLNDLISLSYRRVLRPAHIAQIPKARRFIPFFVLKTANKRGNHPRLTNFVHKL